MRCSKAVVRAGRDKGGGGTGVISHGAAAHLHWVDRKMAEAAREGYGVAVAVPASDAFLLQFRLAQLARLARLVCLVRVRVRGRVRVRVRVSVRVRVRVSVRVRVLGLRLGSGSGLGQG